MIRRFWIYFFLLINFALSLNAHLKDENEAAKQINSSADIDVEAVSKPFIARINLQIKAYNSSLTLSLGCGCYQRIKKRRTAEITPHVELRRGELNKLLDVVNDEEIPSKKIRKIKCSLEEMNKRKPFSGKGGKHFNENVKRILNEWRVSLKK